MSDYIRKYKDYEITVRISDWSGHKPSFSSEVLREKDKDSRYETLKWFDDEKAIETALDNFDRKQRKNFTNPTAYYLPLGSYLKEPQEVTVTTIDENGTEAWITFKQPSGYRRTNREKVVLRYLFTSLEACTLYCAQHKAIEERAEKDIQKLQNHLAKFQWTPEVP